MKPIFFPATYVPDSVAQALTACFGQFIVYQPLTGKIPEQMRNWVERGILDIRVPVTEDQNEIEAVVKRYLGWAELHFGGSGLKPPFLKSWKDSIPFFKDTSSSQVVADIKALHHGRPTSSAPGPLLTARLFLYFAQEFDRQNQEVVQDLKPFSGPNAPASSDHYLCRSEAEAGTGLFPADDDRADQVRVGGNLHEANLGFDGSGNRLCRVRGVREEAGAGVESGFLEE